MEGMKCCASRWFGRKQFGDGKRLSWELFFWARVTDRPADFMRWNEETTQRGNGPKDQTTSHSVLCLVYTGCDTLPSDHCSSSGRPTSFVVIEIGFSFSLLNTETGKTGSSKRATFSALVWYGTHCFICLHVVTHVGQHSSFYGGCLASSVLGKRPDYCLFIISHRSTPPFCPSRFLMNQSSHCRGGRRPAPRQKSLWNRKMPTFFSSCSKFMSMNFGVVEEKENAHNTGAWEVRYRPSSHVRQVRLRWAKVQHSRRERKRRLGSQVLVRDLTY